MKSEMELKRDCKEFREHLADVLLDESYAAAHAEVGRHIAACVPCGSELRELQATFALLDDWTAPEPSDYFDTRMYVRLREAQAAEPESRMDRLRSFLLFSTGRRLRPLVAGALACVLLLGGGGTFARLYQHPAATQASPAVNDLKILDNNAQAMQQMDQLLDSSNDDSVSPTT